MPVSVFTPDLVGYQSKGMANFGDGLALAVSKFAGDTMETWKNVKGSEMAADKIAGMLELPDATPFRDFAKQSILSGADPLKVQSMMMEIGMNQWKQKQAMEMERQRNIYDYNSDVDKFNRGMDRDIYMAGLGGGRGSSGDNAFSAMANNLRPPGAGAAPAARPYAERLPTNADMFGEGSDMDSTKRLLKDGDVPRALMDEAGYGTMDMPQAQGGRSIADRSGLPSFMQPKPQTGGIVPGPQQEIEGGATPEQLAASEAELQAAMDGKEPGRAPADIQPAPPVEGVPAASGQAPQGIQPQTERKRVFPTEHPFVSRQDTSQSNVMLATIEQDGKTYVVPTMVEGQDLNREELNAMIRKHGLSSFPAFDSRDKAEAWAQANHGNIDEHGSLISNNPQPEESGQKQPSRKSSARDENGDRIGPADFDGIMVEGLKSRTGSYEIPYKLAYEAGRAGLPSVPSEYMKFVDTLSGESAEAAKRNYEEMAKGYKEGATVRTRQGSRKESARRWEATREDRQKGIERTAADSALKDIGDFQKAAESYVKDIDTDMAGVSKGISLVSGKALPPKAALEVYEDIQNNDPAHALKVLKDNGKIMEEDEAKFMTDVEQAAAGFKKGMGGLVNTLHYINNGIKGDTLKNLTDTQRQNLVSTLKRNKYMIGTVPPSMLQLGQSGGEDIRPDVDSMIKILESGGSTRPSGEQPAAAGQPAATAQPAQPGQPAAAGQPAEGSEIFVPEQRFEHEVLRKSMDTRKGIPEVYSNIEIDRRLWQEHKNNIIHMNDGDSGYEIDASALADYFNSDKAPFRIMGIDTPEKDLSNPDMVKRQMEKFGVKTGHELTKLGDATGNAVRDYLKGKKIRVFSPRGPDSKILDKGQHRKWVEVYVEENGKMFRLSDLLIQKGLAAPGFRGTEGNGFGAITDAMGTNTSGEVANFQQTLWPVGKQPAAARPQVQPSPAGQSQARPIPTVKNI